MDLQQQIKSMDQCLSRRREQLCKRSLTNASKGLTFSEDVMWERGPDNIQYSKADFSWLFCTSDLLVPITRSKSRKHSRTRVLPRLARIQSYVIPPLTDFPPLQTVRHPSQTINQTIFTVTGYQEKGLDSRISNQFPTAIQEKKQSRTSNGDRSVQQKTTKNTVQQISRGYGYKSRLVETHYGSVTHTDLGSVEANDKEDFCGIYSLSKSNTKPKALQSREPETLLPIYSRIQVDSVSPVCQDEENRLNRLANNFAINYMEPPKLTCLPESLNRHAENNENNTENKVELELYIGTAKQEYPPDRKTQNLIIMENKNLQGSVPWSPGKWTDFPSAGSQSVTEAKIGRQEDRVLRRVGLPTKNGSGTEHKGLRPSDRQDLEWPKEPTHYSPMPGFLRYAVEGWRKAWKIKTNWYSIPTEGLKTDLNDLHWQVRVAAIATCASAAVNRPKVGPDPDEKVQLSQSYKVEALHPDLRPLIHFALHDPMKKVQLAAAVCHYAIGLPNADARNILQNALQHDSSGTGADSWVAAQCLAIEGEASQTVTERLISQLFHSHLPSDQEQAAALLDSISNKSILVQSLLGEQLNCTEWRNRVLACKTISKLKHSITKDLTNKLLYLMWNDWSGLVRQAAAQALDKLGLGSAIHNELCVKLCAGPSPWRVEALVLIGQLKIMTDNLLPGFLQCLNDEFIVVRNQACLAAASLMIKDEMIQNKLFQLMQDDPSCDVKVAAINALARIGWLTPTLQGLLLWTLQHEKEPSVRIAACEAIKTLNVKTLELQNLLQEHLDLETNTQVQRHMEELMKHCGYSLDRDKGMCQMITEQVKKICTKSIITEKLLLLENLKQQKQQKIPRKESLSELGVLSVLVQD